MCEGLRAWLISSSAQPVCGTAGQCNRNVFQLFLMKYDIDEKASGTFLLETLIG